MCAQAVSTDAGKLILYFYNLNLLAFSGFSFALFQDTNWYDTVDNAIADPIFWGRDKGCEFLEGACTFLNTLPEFAGYPGGCDYLYHSHGVTGSDGYSDCNYLRGYSNNNCLTNNGYLGSGWTVNS